MKKTKLALMQSIIALLLCASMLIGTTFAWFTESVSSGNNLIATGNLDVELEYRDADGKWQPVTGDSNLFEEDALWEPGHTEVIYLKISNLGQLALKYQFGVSVVAELGSTNALGEPFKLSDYIQFGVLPAAQEPSFATREDARKAITDVKPINAGYSSEGKLYPAANLPENGAAEQYVTLVAYMPEEVGNAANYQTGANPPKITLGLAVVASQEGYESDSFGTDYDAGAILPEFDFPVPELNDSASSAVTKDENHQLSQSVSLQGSQTGATVPEGVKMNEDAESLTLTVKTLETSGSNLTLDQDESLLSLDVHMEGVSADNTVPMAITLREVAPKGMNSGNLKLYHVENGQTVAMTEVASDAAFTEHNQFKYDPATGDLELYMATFSEVAMVADTENAWKGEFDYSWYTNANARTEPAEYTIANADQLAGFGAIVGGMDGQTQDSFAGKIVKLLSDINLGDAEKENNPNLIFYPIGYYNSTGSYEKTSGGSVTSSVSSFEGTFDGAGHTISNFYQNTWEMFGDYNDGYSGTPNHYKDAMGLFGYVLNGTVKNLTVSNFSSDGEFTPTGVIAAYADGNSIFENIAIINCNPRVYNTGNGGIIGIAGDTAKINDDHITLKNITVDNSNKISALWGSWDVACGGLVGMYRGNVDDSGKATGDTISFENCHVAAQIDVYNDVCANYQYYAYRYAGMIIGSVRHNTTNDDKKTIPNMTGISATGCTVNYGDWNDYYYCEFEKNTMASYSEDYQFSRIPHSELKFTDSNGNGVVDADERDSVTGCKHTHTAAENHQAVYLPFHQLFTGYSWGVSSIGIEELEGIQNITVTIGQEKSEVKFAINSNYEIQTDTIRIGDLFSAIDENNIVDDAIQVSVTDVTKANEVTPNTSVTGTFTLDTDNWENSELKLENYTSDRTIEITIQDYKFCKPTTAVFESGKLKTVKRFDIELPDSTLLYRVGNKNAVYLSTLFSLADNTTIEDVGKVTVSYEPYDDSNAAVSNIELADHWEDSKLNFSGTGPIVITIAGSNGDIPVTLMLEVVDAYNVTKYSELQDRNSVLLNDIEISSGGTYRLVGTEKNRKILYGNGFKFDVTQGAYSAVQYDYMSYVVYLENANLNNIQIVGAVYGEYGGTKNDPYNRPTVLTAGNVTIANSYISNCASPIRNGGNLELLNTTLKGGIYANLDMRNGQLTLDNVTTVNQIGLNDRYKSSDGTEKEIVGLGIVVYQEGGTEPFSITIRNNLKQYNFLSEAQADEYITDTSAKLVTSQIFGNDYKAYQNTINGVKWVNAGIVSMNNLFHGNENIHDERTERYGYTGLEKQVTALGQTRTCYVYSFKPDQIENQYAYKAKGQYAVSPEAYFDNQKNNIVETGNDYCKLVDGVIYISMDQGETFEWNPTILQISKNNKELNCKITMDDIDYTNKNITFSTAGIFTVTYTYVDNNNYRMTADGAIEKYDVTYKKSIDVQVAVVEAGAKHAEFSFGLSGTTYAAKIVDVGGKTYVMPDVAATVSGKIGSKTVNGTTVYYPITEMYTSDGVTAHKGSWYACFPIFKDAVQIVDYADKGTGAAVTYNQTTVTKVSQIPSTLKAVDPKTAFLYSMNATNYPPPTDPTAVSGAVCYTCNRNGLTASNTRKEENTVAEYTYTDNAGKVYYYYVGYHCAEQTNGISGPCVTPDTLITLADGTQVRVDSLTGKEELLVWNHETGTFDTAPVAYMVNHNEEVKSRNVTRLSFSDGNEVKIIGEHVFFDVTLNQYVSITNDNAESYVGHVFAGINRTNDALTSVKLVSVENYVEETSAYEVVSYKHLTCFTNNILSTSAYLDKLLNIFDIDAATMAYSAEKVAADIAQYGLYTYADFEGLISEEAFDLYNAAYLKIAVGKGYITWDDILDLIDIYFAVDVKPIQ